MKKKDCEYFIHQLEDTLHNIGIAPSDNSLYDWQLETMYGRLYLNWSNDWKRQKNVCSLYCRFEDTNELTGHLNSKWNFHQSCDSRKMIDDFINVIRTQITELFMNNYIFVTENNEWVSSQNEMSEDDVFEHITDLQDEYGCEIYGYKVDDVTEPDVSATYYNHENS